MDKRILDHAAAIYARDLKKASEKHTQQLRDIHAEISRRGFQIRDGIAQGMIVAADAVFVGEEMRTRLESLREAFKDAGLQPSTEDFRQIWELVEEVYSTSLAQDRANRSRLSGNIVRGDIGSAAARHHDDVLAEFNVWRSRVGLAGVRQGFAEGKIPALKELPQKVNCVLDLESLLDMNQGPVGVLYLDLDNFKAVNDKYQHEGGDKCIERAAEIIGSVVQYKGRLYRLHSTGDEFAVILPNYDRTEAMAVAERIRSAIGDHNPGGEIRVTASIGVVVTKEGAADEALSRADKAMYVAKQSRNKVHFDVLKELPQRPESYKVLKPSDIELRLTSQILPHQDDHVVRRLETSLVNDTNNRIEKYELEMRIPSSLLKHWNSKYPSEVFRKITGLRCFRFDQAGWGPVRPHDQLRLACFEYCTTCAVNEHGGVGAIVAEAKLSARIWIDGQEYQVEKTVKQLAQDRDSDKTS